MNDATGRPIFAPERRFAWLRLWRSENIGPRTFDALLSRFGSAEAALDALPEFARSRGGGRAVRIAPAADIEAELAAADRYGASFLCRDERDYPAALREIPDAPAVIAVRGRLDLLGRPAIAVVGSRNASAAGLAFTERVARDLAGAGYVVVSGFARGIDNRAHRASLATGTIAVLAGGHDRLYPADQGPLMELLLEDGAAITEMPFGWEARGRDFPRRNRIVSGLSLGVVVVEAARRSGSLITARFAADQGRDVFAVPGSPLDPRAEGTNELIRDGAVMCTSADDVIRILAQQVASGRTPDDLLLETNSTQVGPFWDELDLFGAAPSADPVPGGLFEAPPGHGDGHQDRPTERPTTEQVAERLSPAPVSLDELARGLNASIKDVRGALLQLELEGRIERHGGGLISLIVS